TCSLCFAGSTTPEFSSTVHNSGPSKAAECVPCSVRKAIFTRVVGNWARSLALSSTGACGGATTTSPVCGSAACKGATAAAAMSSAKATKLCLVNIVLLRDHHIRRFDDRDGLVADSEAKVVDRLVCDRRGYE